ncbi:related to Glutaredoxin [Sporisorium scitamineum]|uniref:Related to Glutaredoxin n=1 Tax=Sporisorium scitamineum TaxID=49012 RepID=A0A127Z5T5_9BASI|nr:related to Glutaredoxin [Sporisorium scitamineum]
MGAESKENLLHDLESGVASPSPSHRTPSFCLPPLALLRRKKLLVLLLLLPAVYFMLLYNGTASSPFDTEAGTRMLDALHNASPAINELVGKFPGIAGAHHYNDAHLDKDGHLHNALLDMMHIEGTAELTQLKNKLEHDPATAAAAAAAAAAVNKDVDLALQLNEMTKFDARDESMLLLLMALQMKGYTVGEDWQEVYFDRKPLDRGIFGTLNSGPDNKFTQLLAKVGLPKSNSTKFSILNDAYQLYLLSRRDWVTKVRPSFGLTVFSKSYCPYSKKAKTLLDSLNATYTVYEVDLRPDAHELQPLLAKLTGHRTFPTVLVRDRLLGGNDDVQDLHSIHALKSILESVGAL